MKENAKETSAVAQIRDAVRMVLADETSFGILSSGEKCAVALVLDRRDLMQQQTVLECVDRLSSTWSHAALFVQRNGWGCT